VRAPDRNVQPALDGVLFHVAHEYTIEQRMDRETGFRCRMTPIGATFCQNPIVADLSFKSIEHTA
jgi:hypothetical protein